MTNEQTTPYTTTTDGQSIGSSSPMSAGTDRGVEVNEGIKLKFYYPPLTPPLSRDPYLDLMPASEILSLAHSLLTLPIMVRH